ncbi:hypothetical protein ACSS6W_008521 [Trichoderma asperelloides]
MPYDRLIGPTSQFVDIEKYPLRSRKGCKVDIRDCAIIGQRELRLYCPNRSSGNLDD